jgi:L-alanine-DL-glutamate epimerase-like enolase superfamily enzyme
MGEHDPFAGGITIENGIARLPEGPGLGIEVDWTALERHQAAA